MSRFINQFFTKKDQNKRDDLPDTQDSSMEVSPSMTDSSKITRYQTAACQSTGRERRNNEDTIFVQTSMLGVLDNIINTGVFLVADGMGGHQNGEVASQLAAKAASQYLLNAIFSASLEEKDDFFEVDFRKLVRVAVEEAQSLVLKHVPGGGTTLTLVFAFDDDLYSAHVGDSRIYLVRSDGKMMLKTRDHSLVKRLVDLGEITESEAAIHPQRHVLYRALGQSDPFEPDIDQFTLEKGDRLLICSDGLWSVLSQDQMMDIFRNEPDLDHLACELVQAANAGGGPDNISVVLVERKQ